MFLRSTRPHRMETTSTGTRRGQLTLFSRAKGRVDHAAAGASPERAETTGSGLKSSPLAIEDRVMYRTRSSTSVEAVPSTSAATAKPSLETASAYVIVADANVEAGSSERERESEPQVSRKTRGALAAKTNHEATEAHGPFTGITTAGPMRTGGGSDGTARRTGHPPTVREHPGQHAGRAARGQGERSVLSRRWKAFLPPPACQHRKCSCHQPSGANVGRGSRSIPPSGARKQHPLAFGAPGPTTKSRATRGIRAEDYRQARRRRTSG